MKLIQQQTTTTTYWHRSEEDITEEDIKNIKEKYDGDIELWVVDQEEAGRYLTDENDLVREKDLGTELRYFIEDNDKNFVEI